MITQQELIEFANYNRETGVFTRKHDAHGGRWKKGQTIGTVQYSDKHKSYKRILIRINKKSYYGHQLAFLYVHGYIPKEIAHDNQNSLDNSIDNLSESTHGDNMKNLKMCKLNKSGATGILVAKDRAKKYRVSIGNHGYKKSFYTMDEAVAHRNELERKHNYHENHGIQIKGK